METNITLHKPKQASPHIRYLKIFAAILIIMAFGIYAGLYNYPLFHSFAEISCILVALCAFTIVLNTCGFAKNGFLTFIGIAFGFISIFTLLHTLAYKGMGIFPGDTSNLASQLWIAAQYMESLSILLAIKLLYKAVKPIPVFVSYSIVSVLLLLSIWVWHIFPTCLDPDSGLTPFKIISEYIIISILLFSAVRLLYRKHSLGRTNSNYMILAIIATIVSEFCFTLTSSVYRIEAIAGHMEKLVSFYFIYKAVVEASLKKPYRLLEQLNSELEYNNSNLEFINAQLKEEIKLREAAEEEEMQLRHAIEMDKLKTEFFANISHELKTPLNVILGIQQLLTLSLKDIPSNIDIANSNKYLKVMKQNCYRLLRLINNLIDSTKIESGYLELELKNCDIISVIEDISMSVVDYVNNNGIELIFDTDVEELVAACDPDKIERVILNLLSNAVKFTEPGGAIMVSVCDGGDYITVSVKDTGIGIPADKLETIFDRFKQAEKLHSKEHEGSGIGLSLVKSLVELHGGTICVKSAPCAGSEFLIKLPIRVLPEEYHDIKDIDLIHPGFIERINIEFSDIYTID